MSHPVQYLIIHGKTLEGQRFRPSDWAERLAGVLSQFRPAAIVPSGIVLLIPEFIAEAVPTPPV